MFQLKMKTPLLVIVLLLVSGLNCFQITNEQKLSEKTALPKIPAFIGVGYHVLKGNPFTNYIDSGFRAPIFNFTYSKGQTTEDSKYLIPDYTHSRQGVSCSIQSKVSSYTGTKNYQKQLQVITKIDTRLSLAFLQAAFSFSSTFQQFSNSTVTHQQTSTQSNAQCTVYSIQMPMYSNQIQLNLDFQEGVKSAFKENRWDQFIEHFGTHYASGVTYGGRYFLQHTYSQQSMSLFQSMKLDVNVAAKVQYFNKLNIQLSNDLKKYQNQTNLIDTKVDVTRLSTIGGLPPKSGDWYQWANTVKNNLAPVSYELVTHSVLFNFIHNLDAANAIKSYQGYLNTYCQHTACPPLTPQRPPPRPLIISFTKSAELSGASKSTHAYDTNDAQIHVAMRIYKVLMGSQGSIDSIQFFLTDGLTEHALPVVGNRKFNHEYQVPKSDEVKCIRFGITYNGSYWKFTSMQFVTKRGAQSEVFKGTYNVNQFRILCVQSQQEHIVGFFGKYGNTFDSIGLNYIKETMQK